jgi:hypothetical protein
VLILLDVDGVCVDFHEAALRLHGSKLTSLDLTSYQMEPQMGITPAEFWSKIDQAGPEFWRDIPTFPWFEFFYSKLKEIAPVRFCTTPGRAWECVAGKKMWFDQQLGRAFRDFHITPRKTDLAKSGTVLIDDFPDNVEAFRAAGGSAILFPQPWNGQPRPTEKNGGIESVLQQVQRVCEPPLPIF